MMELLSQTLWLKKNGSVAVEIKVWRCGGVT